MYAFAPSPHPHIPPFQRLSFEHILHSLKHRYTDTDRGWRYRCRPINKWHLAGTFAKRKTFLGTWLKCLIFQSLNFARPLAHWPISLAIKILEKSSPTGKTLQYVQVNLLLTRRLGIGGLEICWQRRRQQKLNTNTHPSPAPISKFSNFQPLKAFDFLICFLDFCFFLFCGISKSPVVATFLFSFSPLHFLGRQIKA